jgi:hypothetical protein
MTLPDESINDINGKIGEITLQFSENQRTRMERFRLAIRGRINPVKLQITKATLRSSDREKPEPNCP